MRAYSRIGLAATLSLIVGCATNLSANENLTNNQTPKVWMGSETWDFNLFGADGEPAGFIQFQLTNEPAETCAGISYLARPVLVETDVLPLESWYREKTLHAAYEIRGALLRIQLNAPICDNDTILAGEISADGAHGRITSSSAFSPKEILIANFNAKLARVPTPPANVSN